MKGLEVSCDLCELKFSKQFNLNRHKKRVHANSASVAAKSSFKCSICAKSFNRKYDLTRHETNQHTIAKELQHLGMLLNLVFSVIII